MRTGRRFSGHLGQATCSVFFLAYYISLPVVSFGAEPLKTVDRSLRMPYRVFPQQATATPPVPPTPITFGQTITGALTSTDSIFQDGRPFDTYSVVAQAPKQSYVITATSPDIPLYSELAGSAARIGQAAFTVAPGQQVQYSGTLQAGRYLISVVTADAQRPVGSYTLSLAHKPGVCPTAPATR